MAPQENLFQHKKNLKPQEKNSADFVENSDDIFM